MRKFSLILVTLMLGFLVSAAVSAHEGSVHVRISTDAELGSFLVGSNGMTLYVFTNDEPGVSNCTGDCADFWPPLTAESAEDEIDAAPGVAENLSIIERDDGTFQVAYNDQPLYFFANDEAPGDTAGHESRDVWFVAEVDALQVTGNEELGTFLAGADGMTLYIFTNDEPGVSNCTGDCADFWPPLTADSMDTLPPAQRGVSSGLSVIERDDGTFQVAYNDQPLYFFANDEAPGDTAGHGSRDVWFVAEVNALRVYDTADLGPVLADSEGMTLYIFTRDEPGVSNCSGECANIWPPLTVDSADAMPAIQTGIPNAFGIIEREGGDFQVTYDEMPLYYYDSDNAPGDTEGQGVRDVWFVIELGGDEM